MPGSLAVMTTDPLPVQPSPSATRRPSRSRQPCAPPRTARSGVPGIEETAASALTKGEQALPARRRDQVSGLRHATVSLSSGGAPRVDRAALALHAVACRGHETGFSGPLDKPTAAQS